ncbi:unnamed protein product [Cochlearia groenlandica]
MQTPKSRTGFVVMSQKKSPLSAPKIARRLKPSGTESDPRTKTLPKTQIQKLATDLPSSRIPLHEIQKKGTRKIQELEYTISQLQKELNKVKEELTISEALKNKAQEEAEEAKQNLNEINASEDSRIEELLKLSQERDKTWKIELEAMQRQHGMDSTALSSAINEVHRLKSSLYDSESKINRLKSAVEEAETRYKEEYIQSTLQIRSAYDETEAVKSRYWQREAELVEELKRNRAETEDLKKLASQVMLVDKEMELESMRSVMEKRDETEAMESELRRVKVQCEQWRKAAETAASMLNNDDEERIDSVESRNNNMLKKFSVLLKKKP